MPYKSDTAEPGPRSRPHFGRRTLLIGSALLAIPCSYLWFIRQPRGREDHPTARLAAGGQLSADATGALERKDNPMVHLGGRVSLTNLPPHYGLIVSLAFFKVDGPNSAAPYRADPPADAVVDCTEIYNKVDLDVELPNASRDVAFSIEHPVGYYFVQIRTTLFRKSGGKVLAQVEPFFFGRRPLPLSQDLPSITLPIEWPSIPVEKLQHYGTVRPQNPSGG